MEVEITIPRNRKALTESLDKEAVAAAKAGFNSVKKILAKKFKIDLGKLIIDEDMIEAENAGGVTTFSVDYSPRVLKLMADPKNYIWFGPEKLDDEDILDQWEMMELDPDIEEQYPKAAENIELAGLYVSNKPRVEKDFIIKVADYL